MIILLEMGGLQGGGINFDAKVRRNSTDPKDLFYAHIGGMDNFARALLIADDVLKKSNFSYLKAVRYSSFDSGSGKDFEDGKLSLSDLKNIAQTNKDLVLTSGRQEYFENLISRFI